MRFRLIYIHIRYIIIHIRRQIICLKYINTYPEREQRYLPEIFRGEISFRTVNNAEDLIITDNIPLQNPAGYEKTSAKEVFIRYILNAWLHSDQSSVCFFFL